GAQAPGTEGSGQTAVGSARARANRPGGRGSDLEAPPAGGDQAEKAPPDHDLGGRNLRDALRRLGAHLAGSRSVYGPLGSFSMAGFSVRQYVQHLRRSDCPESISERRNGGSGKA